ncbi:MAG: hypothetical protein ABIR30_14625 [Chitinophagaceae bacterium]
MKKAIRIALLFLLVSHMSLAQTIPPAPDNMAVVYFARTSTLGFAINFTYFDSTALIAKCKGANFFRYECEPGKHIFWGRSENRDYIEAELEPGKIYFIEVEPRMGAMKASIELKPVDPSTDGKAMSRIMKLMGKKTPEVFHPLELENETKRLGDAMQKGMEKYHEEKAKGKNIGRLEKYMFYKE